MDRALRGGLLMALALCCWGSLATAQVDTAAVARDSTRPWTRRAPRVFGYLQVHFRHAFDTGEDSLVDPSNFRVQRVRLGVKGDVYPWLSYDVEIDPRAPTVNTVLRDAFLEVRGIPRHDLRVGQQKTQFGYENRESSSDLFAVNRTEVSDNFGRGVTLRDIGVGLLGSFKVGPRGFRIEDAITVVNGAGMNAQDDNNRRKNVFGRIGLRWKRDSNNTVFRLGISGASGDLLETGDSLGTADDTTFTFRRVGADLQIDHPRFFLSAEYISSRDENAGSGEAETLSGYYVNLVGKTSREIGPVIRYDVMGDEYKRWTFGGYYGLPAARFRLLVNYEYRAVMDDLRGDDKFYVWTQVRF